MTFVQIANEKEGDWGSCITVAQPAVESPSRDIAIYEGTSEVDNGIMSLIQRKMSIHPEFLDAQFHEEATGFKTDSEWLLNWTIIEWLISSAQNSMGAFWSCHQNVTLQKLAHTRTSPTDSISSIDRTASRWHQSNNEQDVSKRPNDSLRQGDQPNWEIE